MKQILTIIFLLCAIGASAQDVTVTGPKKKTTTSVSNKQQSKSSRSKQKSPTSKNRTEKGNTKKVSSSQTVSSAPVEAAGYDVTFTCNVPTAILCIDGNANGQASGTRFLKTGTHSIKATADDYEDYSCSYVVSPSSHDITINLIRKPIVQAPKPTCGVENGHEWVDLGLSVKWATCNVGASHPEDYGGYYAWGETKSKTKFKESNYFDSKAKHYGNSTGGQTSIKPNSGHDTARENWGGSWRMPTKDELEELYNKCEWINTEKDDHLGFNVKGPNGNCIFIPASGSYFETSGPEVGHHMEYWSSSLYSSGDRCAVCLHLLDKNLKISFINRAVGCTIRSVIE